MSSPSLLAPPDRVLSTLNKDGSRRWLKPRPSPGRFLSARRLVAWILIAIFAAMPIIHINDKPAMFLDIVRREFTFFGKTFLPTDTLLLALLLLGTFFTIFFVTALYGRVWCGWACPQTVYLEFVYRPIERWADGEPGRAKKPGQGGGFRKAVKIFAFLAISFFLAHTFLAYFVGWESLRHWVFGSPLNHPVGFAVVLIVSAAMLFDFGFFREQTCILACPYGRFQSVMLDRQSMIVTYDPKRGEPRGRRRNSTARDVALPVLAAEPEKQGDCVDCKLCVTTCPTGIDIRDGLQMECVNCAQCIDACDSVMTKLGKPRGLIRYGSLAEIETGKPQSKFRPRIVIYPTIVVVLAAVFAGVLFTSKPANVNILRSRGLPFNTLPDGGIANQLRVKVINRKPSPESFSIAFLNAPDLRIEASENPLTVEARQTREEPILVVAPAGSFTNGRREITLLITDSTGITYTQPYRLLGPAAGKESAR